MDQELADRGYLEFGCMTPGCHNYKSVVTIKATDPKVCHCCAKDLLTVEECNEIILAEHAANSNR